MSRATTPMQAAVVTMLIAKRPALDKLSITWELRPDGVVNVEPEYPPTQDNIEKIAEELARAMRGAMAETYDSGDYRVHTVNAQPSGVRVRFYGQYYLGAITPVEGGDGA